MGHQSYGSMCQSVDVFASCHWEEVFRTEHGCVYQSDSQKAIYVDFAGKVARYSIRCLLRMKAAVQRIDLETMATDVNRTSDVEIISICACEHCYVLNISQIVAFRELLEGAFVMFELNSIIQERVYSMPVYQ